MRPQKRPLEVAKIEWVDARVVLDGSEITALPIMTSYGIICHKDREKICICSLYGTDKDERIIQAIPRSLVRKIAYFKKYP